MKIQMIKKKIYLLNTVFELNTYKLWISSGNGVAPLFNVNIGLPFCISKSKHFGLKCNIHISWISFKDFRTLVIVVRFIIHTLHGLVPFRGTLNSKFSIYFVKYFSKIKNKKFLLEESDVFVGSSTKIFTKWYATVSDRCR